MSVLSKWLEHDRLFLLDFDGLLVNSEHLHLKAYHTALKMQGIDCTWTFQDFCLRAHYSQKVLRHDLSKEYPKLQDPMVWDAMYQDKQRLYVESAGQEAIALMPGVETFLHMVHDAGQTMVLVTHSRQEMIEPIFAQHRVLEHIQHQITRGDYQEPKPSPACYELAMERYAKPGQAVIGFEDSPRGLKALRGSGATAVCVTAIPYPEKSEWEREGVAVFSSFLEVI